MEGLHIFEITVKSNDPVEPEKKIFFRFEIVPEERGQRSLSYAKIRPLEG